MVSAGNLRLDSAVSVDDEGFDITSTTVDINDSITTKNGGTADITNSGLLTIASAGDMNLDGKFTQDGEGSVSTAGDIKTSSDDISFSSGLTLSEDIKLDTGSGKGSISFSKSIDGSQSLTVKTGTGAVSYTHLTLPTKA